MAWRWWQRRIVAPASAPSHFAKALASVGVFLRIAVTAPLAVLAAIEVLEAFQLLPDRWGEIAYGLGIADDKQGVALILHTVAMLKALNFRDYGTLTVLINADEEISSPGSRTTLTRLGAEQDAVATRIWNGPCPACRLA